MAKAQRFSSAPIPADGDRVVSASRLADRQARVMARPMKDEAIGDDQARIQGRRTDWPH